MVLGPLFVHISCYQQYHFILDGIATLGCNICLSDTGIRVDNME